MWSLSSYPQSDLYPQAGVCGPASVCRLGYYSNMRSSSREEVVGVFDALRAGFKRALDLRCDALTTPERLALLQSCEEIRRLLPAVEHPLINQLSDQADPAELGGTLAAALANRLRITRADASRRIHEAADLGERRALTGEPLAAGNARHRPSPAQRRPRRRPRRSDPWLLSPAARFRRRRDPTESRSPAGPTGRRAPPRRTGAGWPTPSPTASTPTATSPTPTAPAGAASPSAAKTSTA